MAETYPVYDVSDCPKFSHEQMGSKEKWWLPHPELGLCLFKLARPNTGEDWSEKVAEQLCCLLNLPHARYELSLYEGQRGVISPVLVSAGLSLIHGNEILRLVDEGYPGKVPGKRDFMAVPQHTVSRVIDAMSISAIDESMFGLMSISSPFCEADKFLGYLILDAWIGNTDRHDENWAFILDMEAEKGRKLYLSPTYDHASSLGRELRDEERSDRLSGKHQNRTVERYSEKARSALYGNEEDGKPLGTVEAFIQAARLRPESARFWCRRLGWVTKEQVESVFSRVPGAIMSDAARNFADALLECNRVRILRGMEEMV